MRKVSSDQSQLKILTSLIFVTRSCLDGGERSSSPATFCRSNENNYMLGITFISNIQWMIRLGQNDANGRKIGQFGSDRKRATSAQFWINPSRCVHNFALVVHSHCDIFNFETHDMYAYQTPSSMCKREHQKWTHPSNHLHCYLPCVMRSSDSIQQLCGIAVFHPYCKMCPYLHQMA